jgi:hypothetical protein
MLDMNFVLKTDENEVSPSLRYLPPSNTLVTIWLAKGDPLFKYCFTSVNYHYLYTLMVLR